MHGVLQARVNPRLTFGMVEDAIRKRNYGILSTVSGDGRPHSASVLYAVSARTRPFALYVVTDRRSKKARSITRNPNISFAIPIPRRLSFLPPSSVQFQGTAETLPLSDEAAKDAFNASMVLRRVLKMQLAQKEEVSTFLRVRPDPVIFTYGVGMSILQLVNHIEGAMARVEIPPSRLQPSSLRGLVPSRTAEGNRSSRRGGLRILLAGPGREIATEEVQSAPILHWQFSDFGGSPFTRARICHVQSLCEKERCLRRPCGDPHRNCWVGDGSTRHVSNVVKARNRQPQLPRF